MKNNNPGLIKHIGRLFTHSTLQQTGIINFKVVLLDNGYSNYNHLVSSINNLRKSFSSVSITLITMPSRLEYIQDHVDKGVEIVLAERKYIPKRYRIAFELLVFKRKNIDFIVLLTTDVITVFISLLLVRKRLYIHHPQHKWSLLRRKTLNEHLLIIPRIILNIFVFIYLLFASLFILLKRPLLVRRKT
jgi:hypothetical protein